MELPRKWSGDPREIVAPNFEFCAGMLGPVEPLKTKCIATSCNTMTSDDQVLESYARLDARKATSTKNDFDMWQQATGWNHSSMALMLDPALKAMDLLQPCTQFTHDYMHGVLQGTGPIVLFHLISAMEEILHIYQFLEGYFTHWVFPKSWKSQHIGSYFSKKK